MAHKWFRSKGFRWGMAVVVLLSASLFSYWQFFRPIQADEETSVKTANVRVGDIKISVVATGQLVAAREVDLAFEAPGRIEEQAVELGQPVSEGDLLLAQDAGDGRLAVAQAEIALRSAEIKAEELGGEITQAAHDTALANLQSAEASLSELLGGPDEGALATAQAQVEAARATVATAQASLAAARENQARVLAGASPQDLAIAERKVELAKNALWGAQAQRDAVCGRSNSSTAECDVAQATSQKNEEEVRIAELQLELVREGASAAEVASAQAQVQSANSQLANAVAQRQQAEANLATLQAGPAPDAVAAAEARVAQAREAVIKLSDSATARTIESAALAIRQAELNLAQAQDRATRTELRAPFDAVVVAINTAVGQQVGTAPVIALASTTQHVVRFSVEETDLGLVQAGASVSVSFRAIADTFYTGRVTWVSPVLTVIDGVASAEALAVLDDSNDLAALRPGMEADVEVITASAEDTLLVPADALRALGDSGYAVFVMGEDGELTLRPVEIGIRDFANAQVISGLSRGEVVSTGTIDTN